MQGLQGGAVSRYGRRAHLPLDWEALLERGELVAHFLRAGQDEDRTVGDLFKP